MALDAESGNGSAFAGRQGTAHRRVTDGRHTEQSFDSLTALPNRVLFLESVASALESRKSLADNFVDNLPPFGIMFIDLDGFKDVNDSLGHSAGDQLLIQVARRLESTIRSDSERRQSADIVARIGGDEFAVLIGSMANRREATATANRIQQALAQPCFLQESSVEISASIGIALWHPGYGSPGEILQDRRHGDVCSEEARAITTGVVRWRNARGSD